MDRASVKRYNSADRATWDAFVSDSKNANFLFFRDYMDYHQDRFVDHSLMIFEGDALVALLPASEGRDGLVSHGGLTFGGVLTGSAMKTPMMLEVFDALRSYMVQLDVDRLLYKAIPSIYHRIPAEEDLYALFLSDAELVRRDVSSTIRLSDRPRPSTLRGRRAKAARHQGIVVQQSSDFHRYISLLAEELLERHDALPVHSAEELSLLSGRFPENISLYIGTLDGEMLGGCVVYESATVAHLQYIGANSTGRDLGVLDLVVDHLITEAYSHKRYFDFGISTESQGRHLNHGLILNKESFGARATVYDFYEWRLR